MGFCRNLLREPYLGAVSNFTPTKLVPLRKKNRRKVLILIAFSEEWASVSAVWEKLWADNSFSPTVVLVPGKKRDEESPEYQEMCAFFDYLNVPFIPESALRYMLTRPHFAIYTDPYHSMYSKWARPIYMAKRGVRVCYVPYALEVGGGLTNFHGQYQSEAVNVAWRIFARNHVQSETFQAMQPGGEVRVVTTGHPRTEYQYGVSTEKIHPAHDKAAGRPVVIWNPHFSIDGKRPWSTFLQLGEVMSSLMTEFPSVFFLVRPHPLLFQELVQHPDWGRARVKRWLDNLSARHNALIDQETMHYEAFDLSSGLLSDTSSFLAEYLLTGKPICHLSHNQSMGLSHEISKFKCFHSGSSADEIRAFLYGILSGVDDLFHNREQAKQHYFGLLASTPSMEIIKHLRSAKSSERFGVALQSSRVHDLSFRFWEKAKTTFLAPEEYYKKKEDQLLAVLDSHARGRHAADVGCGNGRFTFLFSKFFESVQAIDPSSELISQAVEASKTKGVSNIDFHVDRVETSSLLGTYDLVSLMGVTSGFLDEPEFERLTHRIKAMVKPEGILILTDTLSLSEDQRVTWNKYFSVYRNLNRYLKHWANAGFLLIESRDLEEDLEALRKTSIYVYKLDAS